MQNKKDSFEENYIAVVEPCEGREGVQTVYRYSGPWYAWDQTIQEQKRAKWLIGAAGALDAVLFFLMSILYIDIYLMGRIRFLTMLSLIALILEEVGVVGFCMQPERMTKPDFEGISTKLKLVAPARAALLFVAVWMGGNYLVKNGQGPAAFLPLVGYGLCAVLSAAVSVIYRSLPYRTEKNPLREQLEAKAEQERRAQDFKTTGM